MSQLSEEVINKLAGLSALLVISAIVYISTTNKISCEFSTKPNRLENMCSLFMERVRNYREPLDFQEMSRYMDELGNPLIHPVKPIHRTYATIDQILSGKYKIRN